MPKSFGISIFYREPKSKSERAEVPRYRHAGLILSLRGRLSTDTWLTRPMSKCLRLGRVVHRHLTDLTNVQMSMSKEGFSFSHTYLTIVRMFVSGEGCPQTPDILDQCPNVRLRGRLFTDNWNTQHMSKHPCPGWVARKHLTDLTNVQICVSQILQ